MKNERSGSRDSSKQTNEQRTFEFYELMGEIKKGGVYSEVSGKRYTTDFLISKIFSVLERVGTDGGPYGPLVWGEIPDDLRTLRQRILDILHRTSVQSTSNSQERKTNPTAKTLIQEAKTLDELIAAVMKIGQIQGSSHLYTADELVDKITRAANGEEAVVQKITDTYDLRTKVRELLAQPRSFFPDQPDPKEKHSISLVQGAQNFEDLLGVIEEIAPIRQGGKVYDADELIYLISDVNRRQKQIESIPMTYGLRQKFDELRKQEFVPAPKQAEQPTEADYALLGLPSSSSLEDVRKAFRRLARQVHSDATGGSDERMKGLNMAYGKIQSFLS